MPTLTEDTPRIARKDHACYFCGEPIQKGEEYLERKGVCPGEGWWSMRMHQECRDVSLNWEDQDFENFEPGSLIRGSDELKLWTRLF
jgi:hypothetical protein